AAVWVRTEGTADTARELATSATLSQIAFSKRRHDRRPEGCLKPTARVGKLSFPLAPALRYPALICIWRPGFGPEDRRRSVVHQAQPLHRHQKSRDQALPTLPDWSSSNRHLPVIVP